MSGPSACRPATSNRSRCKARRRCRLAANLPALDRDKAQFLVIAGKKRTETAWPAGRYTATYRVIRDGAEVCERRSTLKQQARDERWSQTIAGRFAAASISHGIINR
jgi:hypothetical protein